MDTVLNLIREFGALNDAKVRRGGTLADPDEKRWAELKSFYDLLMSQKGLSVDEAPSYSKTDLQAYVTDRARLRVPATFHALVRQDDICYAARVVNLSRSGVFLSSNVLFEVGIPCRAPSSQLRRAGRRDPGTRSRGGLGQPERIH